MTSQLKVNSLTIEPIKTTCAMLMVSYSHVDIRKESVTEHLLLFQRESIADFNSFPKVLGGLGG